jgi:hypothetical protein
LKKQTLAEIKKVQNKRLFERAKLIVFSRKHDVIDFINFKLLISDSDDDIYDEYLLTINQVKKRGGEFAKIHQKINFKNAMEYDEFKQKASEEKYF